MTRLSEQLLEGSPELYIEDGVDKGIEEAVDVTQPNKEGEEHGVEVALRPREEVVSDADGIHDVDGEEGHPAEEEHT